jgi:hypothetical protein
MEDRKSQGDNKDRKRRDDNRPRNDGTYSPQEHERNHELLQKELADTCVPKFSFKQYEKTETERLELDNAKLEWRQGMQKAGLSKRDHRHINVPKDKR